MRTVQIRFITACQQLLALGVVLAVLTPATNVISLDVVSRTPVTGLAAQAAPALAEVPTAPVEPEVEEYAIAEAEVTEPRSAKKAPAREDEGRDHDGDGTHQGHEHGLAAHVAPEDVVEATVSAPIEGFSTVGVTWDAESRVAAGELALQVRTREGEEWGDWSEMHFEDDHAPDPGSPDAKTARNGTDALIVGEVDEVEVRADGAGSLPQGLSLAVIEPGVAEETREEGPAIETTMETAPADSTDSAASTDSGEDAIALQSGRSATKPTIYSRAQWGADEKIRHKSSLSYGSIQAGFVHHTVNANNYTADQVPGIIRSIYTYHVKSRGWSDVGYNFLVDRFGRIWEGRYGGVDKAVIGAHTSGYNHVAFAMSAIGNFETTAAPAVMVNAYGSLFAWKLGLHGIDPRSMKQRVGTRTMPAVNGHRDAGSTACPGKHLYAQLGAIRTKAAAAQTGAPVSAPAPAPAPKPTPTTPPAPKLSAPNLATNLAGTPHPDLVARRKSDSKLVILPTGGMSALANPSVVSSGWRSKSRIVTSADLTGDGVPDLVSVAKDGTGKIHLGRGNGKFKKKASVVLTQTRGHDLLTAVGDINGDGRADLVAREISGGQGWGFLQTANGGFTKVKLNRKFRTYSQLIAVGDITGDGRPDLMGRTKKGTIFTIRALGNSRFAAPKKTPGSWSKYKMIAGGGDFDGDGKTDLLVRRGAGGLYVLPGTGRGSFGAQRGPLSKQKSLDNLSVHVVAKGGSPDLVARRGSQLVHLKNPGTYELRAPIETGIDASSAIHLINAGDWNGDGKGDVITVGVTGALQLRLGDGSGKLSSPRILIGTGFHGVGNLEAVGDVNGDGKPDLIGTVNGVTHFFAGNGKKRVKAGVAVPGYQGRLARVPGGTKLDPNVYDVRLPVSQVKLQAGTTDVVARGRKSGRLFLFTATTKGLTQRRYLSGGMSRYDMFS